MLLEVALAFAVVFVIGADICERHRGRRGVRWLSDPKVHDCYTSFLTLLLCSAVVVVISAYVCEWDRGRDVFAFSWGPIARE